MVSISPGEVFAPSRSIARLSLAANRSAFGYNYIADQFNVTPSVPRPDIDAFYRDRAAKAYHNNDFTAEIEEGDYTKSHYAMADYMIQRLRYGDNNESYQNLDHETIDNRVFSLDDPFVTGRPTGGAVIENPLIRGQIAIDESDARIRYNVAKIVPDQPFRLTTESPNKFKYSHAKKYREYEQDGMERFRRRLVKRDGSTEDSYDMGAPAMLAFDASTYRSADIAPDALITALDNQVDMGRGKTQYMSDKPRPESDSLINFDEQFDGATAIRRLNMYPTGQREFSYDLSDDAIDVVPVRAMMLLKALLSDKSYDINQDNIQDQAVIHNKVVHMFDKFFRERPEIEDDREYEEALQMFSKQVKLDPITDRLDPLATMDVLEQNENGLTRASAARQGTRLVEYDHIVNMDEQNEVALGRYGPFASKHVSYQNRDEVAGYEPDDINSFANIRAITNKKRDTSYRPDQATEFLDSYLQTPKTQNLHLNLPGESEDTIERNLAVSLNGSTIRTAPRGVYRSTNNVQESITNSGRMDVVSDILRGGQVRNGNNAGGNGRLMTEML